MRNDSSERKDKMAAVKRTFYLFTSDDIVLNTSNYLNSMQNIEYIEHLLNFSCINAINRCFMRVETDNIFYSESECVII